MTFADFGLTWQQLQPRLFPWSRRAPHYYLGLSFPRSRRAVVHGSSQQQQQQQQGARSLFSRCRVFQAKRQRLRCSILRCLLRQAAS